MPPAQFKTCAANLKNGADAVDRAKRRRWRPQKLVQCRIAAVEIRAHLPTLGKTTSHWFFEGLFIVLSVGLAFAVGQCAESRAERELAERVLMRLQAEVE